MKPSNKQQDYIDYIRNGDSDGLRKIYSEFLPRIIALITKNGGSSDDAQDVFQDAILVIYEKAKKKDFKLSSGFYTLLYGICRNLWGNRLQKSSFKNVTLSDEIKYSSDNIIDEALLKAEEERVFWDNFKKLGEDCQKLLQLFFEKVKMDEITRILGYSSVGATKKRKFTCKERLVTFIKEDVRYSELNRNPQADN